MQNTLEDCIFCKISQKKLNSNIIYEDEEIIAFYDIYPKAKTHFLVVPKEHISSMKELEERHVELMGQLMLKASTLANKLNLNSYKLNVNNGSQAGQEIFHLHLHILSNS